MATFTQPFSLTTATTSIGPPVTTGFFNADFTNKTGRTVARELFGSSTAAVLDNNFSVMTNSTFQSVSRSLNPPLLRFNPNSGGNTGFPFINVFNGGLTPNWSPWNNFVNNLWKCVSPTTCKIVVGIGFPFTGGYSVNDFATVCRLTAQYLSTAHGTDNININPMYWEIMNEPDGNVANSTYASYFNAAADALHSVNSAYIVSGTTASSLDGSNSGAGIMTNLINSSNATRLNMGNGHRYYYLPNVDQPPDDQPLCQATQNFNTPESYGQDVTRLSALNGGYLTGKPWLMGEWNIMSFDNGSDGRQQDNRGACFAASFLMKCQAATNNPIWGAIWDYYADSSYGQIGGNQHAPFGISPQAAFLSQATATVPGALCSVSTPSGLNTWATVTANSFSVVMVNYTTAEVKGQVGLGHWPINSTGNGTVHLWTVSAANPNGLVQTIPVTAGLTNQVTIPPQGIGILYP